MEFTDSNNHQPYNCGRCELIGSLFVGPVLLSSWWMAHVKQLCKQVLLLVREGWAQLWMTHSKRMVKVIFGSCTFGYVYVTIYYFLLLYVFFLTIFISSSESMNQSLPYFWGSGMNCIYSNPHLTDQGGASPLVEK